MDAAEQVFMAEIDSDVGSVWLVALSDQAEELCTKIKEFNLTRENALATLQIHDLEIVGRAFRCLLRNRIQRAGVMAAGSGLLRSGEDGKGIASRWYPDTLVARIRRIYQLRHRISFFPGDGLEQLAKLADITTAAAFIDPPYFANGRGAGQRLYTHHDVKAEEVFKAAKKFVGPAMITYHRSVGIRKLAQQAGMKCSEIRVQTAHAKERRELLILKS
jgi:DNA adenine methylase